MLWKGIWEKEEHIPKHAMLVENDHKIRNLIVLLLIIILSLNFSIQMTNQKNNSANAKLVNSNSFKQEAKQETKQQAKETEIASSEKNIEEAKISKSIDESENVDLVNSSSNENVEITNLSNLSTESEGQTISSLLDESEIQTVATEDSKWNENSARICLTYDVKNSFGGVAKKNQMHVFAFEGETICLGTNIYNSSISLDGTTASSTHEDKDSYDIVMYGLDGKPKGIDIEQNGKGHIKDYNTEQLAKEMTSPEGKEDDNGNSYVPYTIHVTETGIYSFEFRSYSGSGTTNEDNHKDKTKGWVEPSTNASSYGALISAWDITVFNENGEKKTGRTYTDYLSIQTKGDIKEDYYILTTDSYIYKMHFASVQAYTFTFFANNRGITDIANGNIVYKSVKDLRNDVNFLKFGVDYTKPSTDDTDLAKNFHIFFEEPNADLKGYLYDNAISPDPAENVKFSSGDTYEGTGGYFSFDVKEATTATLRIDFKIGENEYAPVEISDVVTPYSTNYFYWDGKDGNGKTIPASTYDKDEITYSVTTKAGEVHFPLIDIETAKEGITFTRINHIYDKNGNQLDGANSIYDATKNIIYYDDTAIYYREKVTNTGAEEKGITYSTNKKISTGTVTEDTPVPLIKDHNGNDIYAFQNIISQNCSENKAYNAYGAEHDLRVGDHSSFNNSIDYTSPNKDQEALIKYLDSAQYPVAQSGLTNYVSNSSSGQLIVDASFKGNNYNTTTDYGIANFWTFVSSSPVTSDTEINIQTSSDNRFNLTARVFYDEKPVNGLYDKENDGDHLLENVTLNLYKEIDKEKFDTNKTNVYLKDETHLEEVTDQANVPEGQHIYELIKTGVTTLSGTYVFTGLDYDETDGTNFLYQVIKPNSSFQITSSKTTGQNGIKTSNSTITTYNDDGTKNSKKTPYKYGHYTLYEYNTASFGTEIQTFQVGGSDGITFDHKDTIGNNVTTIDVGYKYDRNTVELDIKKIWKNTDNNIETPDSVVLEVCYNTLNGEQIYKEQPLSAIQFWNHSYKYLETEIDGKNITDWYVSAEYYIYEDKIFKHQYEYTTNNNIYGSLVGDNKYVSFTDLDVNSQKKGKEYTFEDIPDLNKDNVNDWNDLSKIPESDWKDALPAGSTKTGNEVVAPFNSVLDRNIGTATTEINITNSTQPGTIEILKYTGSVDEGRYLNGATFRLYKGTIDDVKGAIDHYNQVLEASKTDSSKSEEVKDALQKVQEMQVDSATTRINGRLVFSGLDPEATYTVRERFAPSGYRILNEYYQVNPYSQKTKSSDETEEISEDNIKEFNEDNYCLLYIGNAEASGSLGIQKTLVGRAWTEEDEFTFDISIKSDDVTPNTSELNDITDCEGKIDDFCKQFSDDAEEVVINNENKYATIKEDQIDPNTKIAPDLLKSGIPDKEKTIFENASLVDKDFPVAGQYTFTITENNTNHEAIKYSNRVFTVIIDVARVLDDPDNQEGSSHLEASISKISYVDSDDKDNSEKSITYAGNTPTFINTYIVDEVDQKVNYIVQKNLIGRENNQWKDTDEFQFLIKGFDEVTQKALQDKDLVIEGKDLVDDTDGKKFTIDSSTNNHQYVFTKIDFKNIKFPVDSEGTETPITKPVEYMLSIEEIIPQENEKNGSYINYSQDKYMLKIILENDNKNIIDLHNSETDGVIGTITFMLYKNYDASVNAENNPMSVCKITREKNEEGVIIEKPQHDKQNLHIMTFENTCETTFTVTKTWSGDDDHKDKRPDSIKVLLRGTSKYDNIPDKVETISSNTNWVHTFKDVREFDSHGEKINYSIDEIPVKDKDLVLYADPKIEIVEPKEGSGYEAKITNTFSIPETQLDIKLSKIWDDNNNKAGKRPENITLTFKENNGDKKYDVVLSPSDKDETYSETKNEKWSKIIKVPQYDKDGNEIDYDEFELSENFESIFYKRSVDADNKTITNTFEVPDDKINLEVEKLWKDDNNKYLKRPESIKIYLYKGDNQLQEETLQSSENWKHTFTNLEKYDENGDFIKYKVTEKEIEKDDLFFYTGSSKEIQKVDSKSETETETETESETESEAESETDSQTDSEPETEIEKYKIELTNTLSKIPAKVKIKYIDKYDENNVVQNEVILEGVVGEDFNIESYKSDIPGYTLVGLPETLTGKYTENMQEFTFYYAKNSKVTVRYLEKDTNVILKPEQIIDGYEGHEYQTVQENIDNYTFVSVDGNTEGKMTKDDIVVTYWYLQNTKVTVKHIDKITNEVLKEEVIEGIVGDIITTSSTNIEGYVLESSPESETITMTKDEIVVEYYYIYAEGGVLEKHIDIITDDVIDYQLHIGNEGETYNIEAKEFPMYDLVKEDKEGNSKLPTNSSGTISKEIIEVKYYYIKQATLKVEYIDKETDKKLADDVITNGHEGDKYTAEEKEFDKYTLVEVVGEKEGNLKVTVNEDKNYNNENLVQFYYERKKTKVIERHLDITTDEVIEESVHEGKIGDFYDIKPKEFNNYDLVENDDNKNSKLPTNSKGEMTEEEIIVNYYYLRKAEVEIKYLEEGTNTPLLPPEIIAGHVGDDYTSERKVFDYYDFVKDSENTEGKMTKDKIDITYYYKKQTFNLKALKWINLITVDNKNEKGQTIDTKDCLSQVVVNNKKINKTVIKVNYTIRILNDSQIEGTVNELTEIIPEGFSLNPKDNSLTWSGENNTYKTFDLKDKIIKPGEYYDIPLTLRWNNSGENFGKKISKTVLSSLNNSAGFEEVTIEDNSDEASIIVTLSTGITDTNNTDSKENYNITIISAIITFIILSVFNRKISKKHYGKHSI